MKYQDQFYLLRDLIKESGLARIWVYEKNQYFGTDCSAYVVVSDVEIPEIRICIKDKKEETYRTVIVDLLHEYGHVLDFKQYGKTKRWKLADKFDAATSVIYGKDDYQILKNYPRETRVAVVMSEHMAWEFAKKLVKIWEIDIDPDWIAVEQTAHIQHMIIKLKLQRRLCIKDCFHNYFVYRKRIRRSGVRVTTDDVRSLRLILDPSLYEDLLG